MWNTPTYLQVCVYQARSKFIYFSLIFVWNIYDNVCLFGNMPGVLHDVICRLDLGFVHEFIIGGGIWFLFLCFSIMSFCRFLWLARNLLHLSSNNRILLRWSLLINLTALSWTLFFKLLDCLEQNIRTGGQYLN